MNIIFKTIFGSHLYGTNTENSDKDFKGIYLPSKEECYLNQIKKSSRTSTGNNSQKNTKDDVDEEYYSLQYFFKLAEQGEMCVLDILHSPPHLWLSKSNIWNELHHNRFRFYSKNMKGYLGYIKTQTAKYGVKGSRIASIENLLNTISQYPPNTTLKEIWNILPTDNHSFPSPFPLNKKQPELKHFEICGKHLTETISIAYAKNILEKTLQAYGTRAQQAKLNLGIDWKAVSHAFRAAYQLEEIIKTGDLKYPLKQAPELLKIKSGYYHFHNNNIPEQLESITSNISNLISSSNLPEHIDTNWLNKFIINCYH